MVRQGRGGGGREPTQEGSEAQQKHTQRGGRGRLQRACPSRSPTGGCAQCCRRGAPTEVPFRKPTPVMVMGVPPSRDPPEGTTERRVAACAAPSANANRARVTGDAATRAMGADQSGGSQVGRPLEKGNRVMEWRQRRRGGGTGHRGGGQTNGGRGGSWEVSALGPAAVMWEQGFAGCAHAHNCPPACSAQSQPRRLAAHPSCA